MFNLSAIRKALHQVPEGGFEEVETQKLLLHYLSTLPGITIHTFDFTGILVEYTVNTTEYRLFRADMDALPFEEKTGCDFQSQHAGWMHACGHDIHMTILLGLIEFVSMSKPEQNLLFLFQPAEEGKGGAERILETGILDHYKIAEAYALHVKGNLPVGSVAAKEGIIFAIPQEFVIQLKGKSAHAAFPQNGNDALMAGIQCYTMIHESLHRILPPMEPSIFHIGKMHAGTVCNAVADTCVMEGTHRSLTKEIHGLMNELIEDTVRHVSELYHLRGEVQWTSTYDPVVNHPALVKKLQKAVSELKLTYHDVNTSMTGEDFGFITSRYPGCLFWLGAGEKVSDLHVPDFLPDDDCIPMGVQLFSKLI